MGRNLSSYESCSCHSNPPCSYCENTFECDMCGNRYDTSEINKNTLEGFICDDCDNLLDDERE